MNPRRVAHVITRLCQGGAQENTFQTVRLLNGARYRCDLISGPETGPEGTIEPRVRQAGIGIIRCPQLQREAGPIADLRALAFLTRRFRQQRYDIVHTHSSKAGFVGRLAARRAGVPIVVHTPHGHFLHGYFGAAKTRLYAALDGLAARWSQRIIALTQDERDASIAAGIGHPRQYEVIHSGVDFSPFEEARQQRSAMRGKLGVKPHELLIGGVGRLEPIKGFRYFVAAAGAARAELSGVHFVLAGDGSEREMLASLAAQSGAHIQFLGMRSDVPQLMAAFDICIVPSLNEGMGRVVLEAGAAQTAIIASHAGGIPELLEGGRGVLVPPADAGALASAICRLARNPDERARLGSAARRHFVPHYSLEAMAARIDALYEALIETHLPKDQSR